MKLLSNLGDLEVHTEDDYIAGMELAEVLSI